MPGTNRRVTVVGLVLVSFMAALEATVVGTAMPSVVADLGDIALYGWVGASYLLASTVTIPIYGKLADIYGRKPVLLFGIALFLLGSLASGAAGSIHMLIVARTIQGLGAGSTLPISMTIVGDLFALEERAKVQGAFGSVWGAAGIAGPILAGLIVDVASWRWTFWINVPFGLTSILILTRGYRETPTHGRPSIDWAGAALLATGALCVLLAAEGTRPWVTGVFGMTLLGALSWVERRVKEPVIPLALLARRSVFVSSLSSAALGVIMMGTLMFVPLYVQGVLGGSPTEGGSAIAPMLVGWPIAAAVITRVIVRVGFAKPVLIGAVLCAGPLSGLVYALSHGSSLWTLRALAFATGLGMGSTNTAILLAVQSGVERAERGVATASVMFARSMGGAMGTGLMGALFAQKLGESLPSASVTALLGPERDVILKTVAGIQEALSHALLPVFVAIAGVSIVNLVVVGFYPRKSTA
ncbi:MAG: MFS transporter [Deltaproteobacteria bacterium]|nr:MFS transporter [Deltaproteobacteria bacterium]